MIKIQKFAAVDIGSNAVRLLISSVVSQNNEIVEVKKISLVRVPIRLGADGFLKKKIKKDNINRLKDAMIAFKLLMKIHGVLKYKVCATSAMREASNREEVIEKLCSKSKLQIDVISGKEEASIIADTFLSNHFNFDNTYLELIDLKLLDKSTPSSSALAILEAQNKYNFLYSILKLYSGQFFTSKYTWNYNVLYFNTMFCFKAFLLFIRTSTCVLVFNL
jgi:hypothetical protein